ncbi:MAG: phosphatase PAP2 family protein, partial [Paracoccaceae bacterium]
ADRDNPRFDRRSPDAAYPGGGMTQLLAQFVDFLGAHQALTVFIAFLVAFAEALLILGLFVPSTTVLVGIGTLIGLGKMSFLPVFAATVLGAIAGDALSFWAGVHWKDRIRTFWPFSRYTDLMAKGEGFVARHGGKSIFIVRFIPGVKAVVPTIAGMMGMSVTRFALVNVGSALVWAAAHLLPAILLGRGLQVAHAANPRFVLLAGLGLVAMLLAWGTMRLARGILIPAADRGRLRLALWLEAKGAAGGGALAKLLRNHDGMLEAALLAGVALCGLAGFGLLLAAVAFDPEMALADAAIGQFVQGLRTDWATSAMIGITMLGDLVVVLPVAVLLIAILAAHRQWILAALAALAPLAGVAFVPLFKALLHRARPIPMYQGTDGFSFPSGHSTFATIIFGLLALFVAQSLPQRFRTRIYGLFAALIALIALSRVYLQAHWPSDVLAGILFGGALVFFAAMILHTRVVTVPRRAIAALLALIVFGIAPLHLATGWSAAATRYDATPPLTTLASADWQATGWQSLPVSRILLTGEAGEPMLLQSDLPLDQLETLFQTAGWTVSQTSLTDDLLGAILPSRRAHGDHPPWPMTHLGRPPLTTLTKPGPDDLRLVLRIWRTDTLVQDAAGTAPLLLVSVTADRLDPVAFGFAQLEEASAPVTDPAALGLSLALRAATDGKPLLLPR